MATRFQRESVKFSVSAHLCTLDVVQQVLVGNLTKKRDAYENFCLKKKQERAASFLNNERCRYKDALNHRSQWSCCPVRALDQFIHWLNSSWQQRCPPTAAKLLFWRQMIFISVIGQREPIGFHISRACAGAGPTFYNFYPIITFLYYKLCFWSSFLWFRFERHLFLGPPPPIPILLQPYT